ncbi:DUF86 domain-containing protein [Egibacter rhizosphaerae]|uniref:DUF86 domain-containing protein n=1 Tax=Egibacter rhizosphaerae TaxID=1670831 RepID=A0A411YF28_9ACTN|nr:DUF86 domain-containing protein [Egibacter rhizosphaerae]QBI19722.1 DUF86 domain-containing protein [Egibacter rhizosphaerae]
MVDPEVVTRRLRELDRRLAQLERLREHGRDTYVADEAVQAQGERHLQVAIQCAIDVALHVAAERSAATPEDYADAFRVLGEAGVIDRVLAGRLAEAAGLRNVLVHAYLTVDPERVWEHLGGLQDLRELASAILVLLEDGPPRG